MDITFNCPHCEQELAVDASAAGSSLECPSCNQSITVPEPDESNTITTPVASAPTPNAPPAGSTPPANAAAAAPPKHFVVPMHAAPAEALISKPNRPLEVAAKESDRKLRIKTIKHTDCVEVGHDRFDELVSLFLDKVGQQNIVSINTINYSTIDIGTHLAVTDFGVVVVYRG